jgi:choline-sulfatase
MAEQPNILVFLTDDHARWAFGCYGNREVQTPNLDYLAQTGVKMVNAYTPIPVCSAARACFFTGLYPSQHGIHDWIFYMEPRPELPPEYRTVNDRQWIEDRTIAEMLGDAGYETALVGKWHCGQDTMPQKGFQHWYGLKHHYPARDGEYSDNGQMLHRTGYHTDIITDESIRFLNERETAKPFFLFVGYIGTHTPWREHPERYVSRFREATFADIPEDTAYALARNRDELPNRDHPRELRAQYYAGASHIDEGVGRVVDELEALGIRENTLVVYTADHGIMLGQHGIWGKGNGTRPHNMLDEAIRIPMIFNLPGNLLSRQVRPEFVDHCDLFSTLMDFAGVTPEQDKALPGRSFLPILERGFGMRDWKPAQICEYGNLRMIRTPEYKLVRRYPDGYNELYDLQNDPRETRNLFDKPAYAQLTDELTAAIDDFFAAYQDPVKSGLNVANLPTHNPYEPWRLMPE